MTDHFLNEPDLRFEARPGPPTQTPALPAAALLGITVRPATDSDIAFLSGVYASTRLDELAVTGWPTAARLAFLHQQFRAQHHHYQLHYGGALWLVIEQHAVPVGRLYLAEWRDEIRIVDVALLPAARAQGIGTAMLIDLARHSSARGKPLSVHVERDNPARRLYERHGFVVAAEAVEAGVYDLMRRPVSSA